MASLQRCLAIAATAGALAPAPAPAMAADAGPYVTLAVGATEYNADCSFYSCGHSRATAGKVGVGYQFGIFAVEAWAIDWGKAPLYDFYADDHVRLRSLGIGAAWHARFGTSLQGVLRAGAADVRQTRTSENFRHLEATFGLGLAWDIVPTAAVELGYDLTTSTGGSSNIGSVLGQVVSLGLRLRF